MPLFRLEPADEDPLPPGSYIFGPADSALPPLRFSLSEPVGRASLGSALTTIVQQGGEIPSEFSADTVADYLHDAA